MAKEAPSTKPKPPPAHKKLPQLSKDHKISKRPLLHPSIAPPRSSSSTPKIVYISASTPFISAVKRVRKLLDHIEDRATGPISVSRNPREAVRAIQQAVASTGKDEGGRGEEVVMKGTGKAIERVLQLALYWQGERDVRVQVRTGSVGAVDDVVGREDGEEVGEGSRVRRVSCLEVGVRLV